jgi:hypothetical protein
MWESSERRKITWGKHMVVQEFLGPEGGASRSDWGSVTVSRGKALFGKIRTVNEH